MGNKIVICHWDHGGHWTALEVSTSALKGHDNHLEDIWPPVEGVTDGQNWPRAEAIYLNDCVMASTPEPTPTSSVSASPSPSDTLPDTGARENLAMALVGLSLIAAGIWLKVMSGHHHL